MPIPVAAIPPGPLEAWCPWLWRIAAGLTVLVVFILGMEVGYQRAASRYQLVIQELTQTNKTPAEVVVTAKTSKVKVEPVEILAEESPKSVVPVSTPKAPPPAAKVDAPGAMLVSPKEPPPAEKLVRFDTHIQAIIQAKCVLCHGGKSIKSGLDLRTAAAAVKGGDGGPGVVPGTIESSVLWDYVKDDRMPPGKSKLTSAEKRQIQTWIVQGAR